jgi:hypothetical protein
MPQRSPFSAAFPSQIHSTTRSGRGRLTTGASAAPVFGASAACAC